ncbi:MAG: hypothetical protein IPJ19_12640 [Planctomycetes bacterium]|nr:hypothetical protein [Planctomycetota bacterium]
MVLTSTPGWAGGIAIFRGPAAATGDVEVFDELSGLSSGAPAQLQGIRLLEIDFVGRTRLEELLPGRPRRKQDIAGASRLALFGQRGSLYHFARAEAGGGSSFGYFRIASDGTVLPLLELPGTGPTGGTDPFLARVAIAPDSTGMLAASTVAAGGNLYEIDLSTGAWTDRTSALPPLRFSSAGLSLQHSLGLAATKNGVLRFQRGAAGDAQFVPFSTAPAWFSGELAASHNGDWFLTSAGADPAHQLAFAIGGTGGATAVSQQPAAISIAGYEPEASDGPYMAIRDDGQQAAWRIEAGITREVLLAHVQPLAGELPQELSATTNFLDTLDEIGLAIFMPSGAFHVAIGKSPAGLGNALESFDTYAVTLPANGAPASFVNLSLYSGDATVPFLQAPAMKARDWRLLPDRTTLLVHDDLPADGFVDAVALGTGGAQPVLGFVRSLDGLETAGRWLLADIRRSDSGHAQELWRMPLNLATPATLVQSAGNGSDFTRFAARRDGWIAFVARQPLGGGSETLERLHMPSGTLQTWNPNSLPIGPALGFTQFGSIALSVNSPVTGATWPISAQAPVTLQVGNAPCQILPGL